MNPNRKSRLQQIYNALNGKSQATQAATDLYRQSVLEAESKLKAAITATNLDEVNKKIKDVQKSADLKPLLEGLKSLQSSLEQSHSEAQGEITSKLEELRALTEEGNQDRKKSVQEISDSLQAKAEELSSQISLLQSNFSASLEQTTQLTLGLAELADKVKLSASKKTVTELRSEFEAYKLQDEQDDLQSVGELKKLIQDTKAKLLSALAGKGGSMNRQIYINGTDPLTKWTDINLKAGSNITIAYADNAATHKVDVTISSSGGGGSVAGTVRSINRVAASQTMGSVAGTDYVYIATDGIRLTLPDATGLTNLYTVKNISTSSVLVDTTSAQTIDLASTQILNVQFTAIDIVNDGNNNWSIT